MAIIRPDRKKREKRKKALIWNTEVAPTPDQTNENLCQETKIIKGYGHGIMTLVIKAKEDQFHI